MNKKAISTLIVFSLVFGIGVQAHAQPLTDSEQQQIQDNRSKYADINSKIDALNSKIDDLDNQIEPLVLKIQKNKDDMEKTKKDIKNTEADIEKAKEDLKVKEELFGERMAAIYKSGGQESYLAVILSSRDFSDFVSKMEAVGKIMSLDKEIINDLNDKKEQLDKKIKDLSAKNDELDKLNATTQTQVDQFNAKKDEQLKVIAELKVEKAKIVVDLSDSEKVLIAYPVSIIDNPNSSSSDIQSAIDMLRSVRPNLASTDVDQQAVNAIEKAKSILSDRTAQTTAPIISRGGSGATPPPASSLLAEAYRYIGTPYVYGATGPSSFDCSGFTSYVFRRFGISLPRTTYEQINVGSAVSYGDLQPGDLVFTNGGDHVGIYVGGGQMIHAPRTGEDVKVGPIYHYYAARRVR